MNFDKQLDVFSRNLSEIRRNGRYSYQSFSEKLRVGKSTVQAIESGDYNITLSTLITIANSLEIHPALLLMDLPIELDLTGTNRCCSHSHHSRNRPSSRRRSSNRAG